ncbi:HesA/MoeB/ThiF family protein [Candidatus Woesearchaeota archaeon]|nr:HesA/MoeB/ThiF family protein [Candidatus Woesearchaeota archaeon]MCF8014049.1 HesA/MoeB/ThiF family protein [Candidatus Woesearchaeota archaeon]
MDRYIRQTKLSEIGEEGQNRLKSSSIVVVGVGALGTFTAQLLCRMGIGRIHLIDADSVSLVNLHRQVLFDEKDLEKKKVVVAKEKLEKINSDMHIEFSEEFISEENVDMLLSGFDLILDCTDNMKARHVINDFCLRFGKTWIYSAASSVKGNVAVIDDPKNFDLIFKTGENFDRCSEIGVFSPVCSLVSSVQVSEAIKFLLGKNYSKDLLRFNLWDNSFEMIGF